MYQSEYNRDQIDALRMIRRHLEGLSPDDVFDIKGKIDEYLRFREDIAGFQKKHLSEVCETRCFTSESSACCNREGIATFFADVVINCLVSSEEELDQLEYAIMHERGGFKCLYLTKNGCLWNLKPIVCEMFLCDQAKQSLITSGDFLMAQWEDLRRLEKRFTWPDKPVLFDVLEALFIQADIDSPLMYFHKSPGLIMLKKMPGVNKTENIGIETKET